MTALSSSTMSRTRATACGLLLIAAAGAWAAPMNDLPAAPESLATVASMDSAAAAVLPLDPTQAPRWSSMDDLAKWWSLSPAVAASLKSPPLSPAPRELVRPLGAGQAAPEPGLYALTGIALLGLALLLRRRSR